MPSVKVMELKKEMYFPNMDGFRFYIRTYAILKKFVFEYVMNNYDRVKLKCVDPGQL